jgi:CO/xanthine dehydrogenase Mo-binding subunit
VPAIANAVFDAIGVRIDNLPISPEKVLKALRLSELAMNVKEVR